MGKFEDSITIARGPREVQSLLADLQRHPTFVPDGFKNYRYLSRETAGVGARAAVEVNLLGHWLPAELQVLNTTVQQVVLHSDLEPASLELRFDLVDRGGRTEVRLTATFSRRALAPWRVRTRIKQKLRLDSDVAALCGRFLSSLKKAAESDAPAPSPGTGGKAPSSSSAGPTSAPAAGPTSAPAAGPSGTTDPSTAPHASSPASSPAGTFVTVGPEADIRPGQSRVVKVGSIQVAVFNINGEFHAISNACPHRGGPLAFGVLDGSVVACPLHGWTFDVTTGQCTHIDGLKVPCFEVRRVDGVVQVRSTPIAA